MPQLSEMGCYNFCCDDEKVLDFHLIIILLVSISQQDFPVVEAQKTGFSLRCEHQSPLWESQQLFL